MRRWRKRCLSFVLAVVLLFCTIPVSGATGSWGQDETETESVVREEKEKLMVASDSNMILDEDEVIQPEELVDDVMLMGADTPNIQLTGVEIISKPKDPLKVNAKFKLRRNVTPSEATVNQVWTSTDHKVATIDVNGNVEIVGDGTVTIKIEVTGKGKYEGTASASYEMTVLPAARPAVTGVTITSKPTAPVKVGASSFVLGYQVAPNEAIVTPTWTSTNPAVALIGGDGNVTIVGAGKTTIELEVTGKDSYIGSVSDRFELTVLPAEESRILVTGVEITSKPKDPLKVGAKFKLRRNVTPSEATVDQVWTSTDHEVARIDVNGNVEIVGAGTATIKIEITGKEKYEGTALASYEMTVLPVASPAIQVTGVTITSKPTVPKYVGDSPFKLRFGVAPEGASVVAVWTSTNHGVATIDEYGNVTIAGAGTTTIKLAVTGQKGYEGIATDSYDLTILPERGPAIPITKVAITGKPTTAKYVGDASFKVRYTTTPYGAAATAIWTSTNPEAASIDQYGNVTMVGAGKTTIKLEITGKDGYEGTVPDSFILTVLPVTLTLDKNEVFLDRGESAVVTVNFGPESAKLMNDLPMLYQVDGTEEMVAWPTEYLSTTRVENGKFPDNKLTIKIEEQIPENVAYGKVKMRILLLKQDAIVEEGDIPASEDVLLEEEITIYFREKKAPTLPPVKPGVPRVDRLKDALDKIEIDHLTSLAKKELANEVLESLEKQKITVKHTIGNETLAKNLVAVEEKLEVLLDIKPGKSGASEYLDGISFTGSLFNVAGGKTPVLMVEDEIADDDNTSGMGVLPTSRPVALDIKLATEDGAIISKLKVPMRLRIDASAMGLNLKSKIVIKHIKSDGKAAFLPYTIDGSEVVFWVSDFSTFIFANGSTNAEGGTSTGGGSGGGSSSGGGSGGGGGGTRAVLATVPATGSWRQDTGGWRYEYTSGAPLMNTWIELGWNGKADWYHFNAQAYADGGWLQDGGHTYYLNPLHNGQFGVMMTGWQQVEGKWYYFQTQAGGPKGAMLRNTTTPDGFLVGADGARR